MLSSQDHPAIFSMLIGLIVLVMTAVGFSLMVDRRFQFSSGARQTERDIAADALVLETLRDRYDNQREAFDSQTTRATHANYLELVERSEELENATGGLSALSKDLADEIASLEERFREYRADYRRATWAAAEGEKLGTIQVRGGREYRDAVVKKVTPVGLEIHLADGLARIQGPDLDLVYQDRFQWDAEERHLALEKERDNRARIARRAEESGAPTAAATRPTSKPPQQGVPSPSDLAALRFRVRAWQAKVDVLRAQTVEATSNASYGSRRSVPSSLETWQTRAVRLRTDLGKADAELSVAKSRLLQVSPGDPLLHGLAHEE